MLSPRRRSANRWLAADSLGHRRDGRVVGGSEEQYWAVSVDAEANQRRDVRVYIRQANGGAANSRAVLQSGRYISAAVLSGNCSQCRNAAYGPATKPP